MRFENSKNSISIFDKVNAILCFLKKVCLQSGQDAYQNISESTLGVVDREWVLCMRHQIWLPLYES